MAALAPNDAVPGGSPRGDDRSAAASGRGSAWGYLVLQVSAGLVMATAIQVAYFLVKRQAFPFETPYARYSPEFIIAGLWLGYCLSGGRLIHCRCWWGVLVGQPAAFLILAATRAGGAVLAAWAQYPWSFLVLRVALLGTAPAFVGELAGVLARKGVTRFRSGRARSSSPARPRFQFSLLAMLGLVTLWAAYFPYLEYYGPATIEVSYRVLLKDRRSMDLVLSSHAPKLIDDPEYTYGQPVTGGSTYAWVILDDDELAALMHTAGQPVQPMFSKTRIVSSWPLQGLAETYHESRTVCVSHADGNRSNATLSGGGGLSCFLGCRRAGMGTQFRVEASVGHSGPGVRDAVEFAAALNGCDGRIFYQGALPKGHLVFFAPLDAGTYHVLIFDGKRISDAR